MLIRRPTLIGPGSGLAAVIPTCGRVIRTTGPRFVSKMLMVRILKQAPTLISGIISLTAQFLLARPTLHIQRADI